jgi:hypothetical protein
MEESTMKNIIISDKYTKQQLEDAYTEYIEGSSLEDDYYFDSCMVSIIGGKRIYWNYSRSCTMIFKIGEKPEIYDAIITDECEANSIMYTIGDSEQRYIILL